MIPTEAAPVKMLFLLFKLGRDRYVIDIARVLEILPLLDLKKVPRASPEVAGVFNYRGAPVPVIDVSAALLGTPARRILSTRLVLVRQPDGKGWERPLGLILEGATGTLRRDPSDFSDGGVTADGAPCLGPVAPDPQGLLQWVEPDRLLSDAARAALFQRVRELSPDPESPGLSSDPSA